MLTRSAAFTIESDFRSRESGIYVSKNPRKNASIAIANTDAMMMRMNYLVDFISDSYRDYI